MYRAKKECINCKGELIDGTISKAFGYCPPCHEKLVDGPETHAEDYILQLKKRPHVAHLAETE